MNIHLVKAAEVLLLVRRPEQKRANLGPQPENVLDLPVPPTRKPVDLPSAAELIAAESKALARASARRAEKGRRAAG